MKIKNHPLLGLLFGLVALTACGDSGEPTPEQLADRQEAYRLACATGELLSRADADIPVVEGAVESFDPQDMLNAVNRRAAASVLEFARAYQQHAQLRAGAYALLDSAVNHAASTGDSIRYVERASAFSLRFPDDGTIESNVLTRYQTDLAVLMADQNHPCNWDFPDFGS
jgi:hypothetical protein